MRPDYLVYRKATQVSGFGLLLQLGITLSLVIFGLVFQDSAMVFAALFAAIGLFVWVSLIIVFHQHGLERLESLEEDEAHQRTLGTESVFTAEAGDTSLAARRLRLMHKWAMPIVSIVMALLFALHGWSIMRFFEGTTRPDESATDFLLTPHRGWAIAICLSIALISFIFSRFVAGMSKVPAWQNLRGGAGSMVGNSVVTLALAIGLIFRFFENDRVIEIIARAMPFLLFILSLEIGLNFILNLYRPRIAGEVPRPAFDSRILSLLTSPDSIVRTVNEAVNYQFGFDIASSWGYQLLLRSLGWLLLIGVGSLVLLNTMVIVEPHQQGVRLRAGHIVGDRVYESGIMWKLPWPFETAELYDVGRVRQMSLTGRQIRVPDVNIWSNELRTDVPLEPFIVSSPPVVSEVSGGADRLVVPAAMEGAIDPALQPDPSVPKELVDTSRSGLALVTAEVVMQYRIRSDNAGLIDYLQFAPDSLQRRQQLNQRDRAIKALALREVAQYLMKRSIDDVLSTGRISVSTELRQRVQTALDDKKAGVQVVSIDLLTVRPGSATEDAYKADEFEDITFAIQERLRRVAEAEQAISASLTAQAGEIELADQLIREITLYRELERSQGSSAEATIEQRTKVEELFSKARGAAAQMLAQAEAERWKAQMGARGQSHRVAGEVKPYLAAPELYRQRRMMDVLTRVLMKKRKYFLGLEGDRVEIDFDVTQLSDMFNFAEFMGDDEESGQ